MIVGTVSIAVCLVALVAFTGGTDTDSPRAAGSDDPPVLVVTVPLTVTTSTSETPTSTSTTRTPLTSAPGLGGSTTLVSTSLPPHLVSVATDHLIGVRVHRRGDLIASGIYVDGFILTSAAAIDSHGTLLISGDHGVAKATLLGIDPFSDLAVLVPVGGSLAEASASGDIAGEAAPEPEPEPAPAPEGDAEATFWAGQPITVLAFHDDGVISTSGEVLAVDAAMTTHDGHTLVGAIETTVRRRGGDAGGLVVDADGSPIGLIIESKSSLAVMVPLADALVVAGNMLENGWASDSWIGIEARNLDPGVEILAVHEGSPAADAGLRRNDVIRLMDDHPVRTIGELIEALRRSNPGQDVVLTVERGPIYRIAVKLTVGSYPSSEDEDGAPGAGVEEALSASAGG